MNALTALTLVAVLGVVLALVYYLVRIIRALDRAGDHLEALVAGLETVRDHTRPLPEHLATINQALGRLWVGLRQVDANLLQIVRVLHR